MDIDEIKLCDFPVKNNVQGYDVYPFPSNDEENIQFLTEKINELIKEVNRINMRTDVEDAKFKD